MSFYTYKLNVSLNLGDQLFDLDFVAYFRFLSLRFGPIRLTSTNGRNTPWLGQRKSLAATTKIRDTQKVSKAINSFFDVGECFPLKI